MAGRGLGPDRKVTDGWQGSGSGQEDATQHTEPQALGVPR